MEKELFSRGKSVLAFGTGTTPVTISSATTTYGNWIDTEGFNSATFSLSAVLGGSQTVSAILIYEADTPSSYADAALSDTTKYTLYYPSQLPIAAGTVTIRAGSVSKKRFIKIGLTTTTTDSSTVIGFCELNNAITSPSAIADSVLAAASINAPSTTADSTVTPPKR